MQLLVFPRMGGITIANGIFGNDKAEMDDVDFTLSNRGASLGIVS